MTTFFDQIRVYFFTIILYSFTIHLNSAYAQESLTPQQKIESENITGLYNQFSESLNAGDYKIATQTADLAIKKTKELFGPDTLETAAVISNVANLYREERQHAKAEQLFKDSINIFETSIGEKHINFASVLGNLSLLYLSDGNYKDALIMGQKSLEIVEESLGVNSPQVSIYLYNLALIYSGQSDFLKARSILERSLAISKKAYGENHEETAISKNALGNVLISLGDLGTAEKIIKQALETNKLLLGEQHISTAESIELLANLNKENGSYANAEFLYLKAIEIIEKNFGSDNERSAVIISNLAVLYAIQEQYNKAEPLLIRALDIEKKIIKPNHLGLAVRFNNLAEIYRKMENYDNAEIYIQKALSIWETKLGSDHPNVASASNVLGLIYEDQGKFKLAEEMYIKALSISEKRSKKDNINSALFMSNLGLHYLEQKKLSSAERLLERALSIRKILLEKNHPDIGYSEYKLADLHYSSSNFQKSHYHYKSAVEIYERRVLTSNNGNSRIKSTSQNELENKTQYFYGHAITSQLLSIKLSNNNKTLLAEAYSSSQYALRTSAGAALGQAAARFAAKNDALSETVRNRQDLTGEWSAVNDRLTNSISSAGEGRNKQLEQTYRERLVAIDDEIADIDTRLEADFPEYFALTSPKPLGVEETQGLLYDNEALVMFLAGDKGTLIFALTKDKADWTLVDVDASELETAVRVLRASLENPQQAFPRGQAHGIYKELMSGVEDLVSDKDHVFLVPSGALGSIPLGVLVVDAPVGDDSSPEALRATKWWGTEQALTTLPSISSLKALRLLAKDGRGTEPFAGFGNPVLTGPDGTDRSVQYASRGAGAYFKGKYADVEAVRSLSPLPKTETELLSLASAMRSKPEQSLWLGDRATETNLKAADLSEKRVLAFATHGLMSGEMSGLAEPALVLTPPDNATDQDDGLLTASEAALLNLNADWVILSACNTAAADEPGADGLSGLARSFFYAGARSMLVSHWPVRDDAAARLTTAAISMQDDNPDLGRAEALRRSMLVLMNDTSDPTLAHPSAWAPFVIVGEGGSEVSTNKASFDPIAFKTLELKRAKRNSGTTLWAIIGGMALLILTAIAVLARRRRANLANV